MRNWKTTLGGLLFVAGQGIKVMAPSYAWAGEALATVAVGFLGYHAQDK